MSALSRACVLVAGLLASHVSIASTPCAAPDLDTLVHHYEKVAVGDARYFGNPDEIIKKSIPLVEQTGAPSIVWIGTKFESDSTPVGLLFAVTCDGKIIDTASIGSVRELSRGPTLPKLGDTILTDSVSSAGSDMLNRSFAIFAVRDGKIVMVWSHISFSGIYAWMDQPDDGEETTFNITKIDRNSIELSATKVIFVTPEGKKPSRNHVSDKTRTLSGTFKYCWNDAQSTYIACDRSVESQN
jgi:hypothetical protein